MLKNKLQTKRNPALGSHLTFMYLNLTSTGRAIRCYDAKALLSQGPRCERAKIVNRGIAWPKKICFFTCLCYKTSESARAQSVSVKRKCNTSCSVSYSVRISSFFVLQGHFLTGLLAFPLLKLLGALCFWLQLSCTTAEVFPKFAQHCFNNNLRTRKHFFHALLLSLV